MTKFTQPGDHLSSEPCIWWRRGGGDDVDGGGRQLFPSLSEEKRLETWPVSLPSFLVAVLVVKSFRTVGSVPLAGLQVPHLGPLILMRETAALIADRASWPKMFRRTRIMIIADVGAVFHLLE